jgi:D-glycero-alpha-D-manno-heptose-7-phosphate kinase
MTTEATCRRVRVSAPVRVLDAGGWTDTWFATTGNVCSVAVDDGAEVVVERVDSRRAGGTATVELVVPAFDDRYEFTLDRCPGRHPLLESTLRCWAPSHDSIRVTVASNVPPGSGLGTSASVVVALVAALDALTGAPRDPAALAHAAHAIETVEVGLQSGVQDQIAAAYGGCNFITIDPYPDAVTRILDLPSFMWDGLTTRVITVYLDAPHRSGALHEKVIEAIGAAGKHDTLASLRAAARDAADALVAGDIDAYGQAMIFNTEAQAALHPTLVSERARDVIAVAKRAGAIGWKVNGAGGNGGTITIVGPTDPDELRHTLASTAGLTILALKPARQGARLVDRD